MFTISVTNLSCTDFQVSSLKSSAAPWSNSVTKPSISMDLDGISATCTGSYDAGIGISGNIVASLSGGNDSIGLSSLFLKGDIASRPLQDDNDAPNDTHASKIGSLPFPTLATLSACQPNFLVHDIQFSGSASAHIIGLFSSTVEKTVTNSLNDHVCKLIKKNGEDVVDKIFYWGRMHVGGLILNSTSTTAASADVVDGSSFSSGDTGITGTNSANILEQLTSRSPFAKDIHRSLLENDSVVSWDKDMPFLMRILLGLNNFVSQHLNEGIVLKVLQKLSTWQSSSADCEDCGFFFKGVNGLVNSLTKGLSFSEKGGSFDFTIPDKFLNFHRNHTFTIPSYGDIVLTAHKVKVSGINNLTDLSFLRPSGQNSLSSSFASNAGLNVSVLVDLELRPANEKAMFHGDTLNETFELHFDASNVNFTSDSAWDVDREMFSKLSVGSFIYGSYTVFDTNRNFLNCIFEALSSVAIIDMQGRINLDAMRVSPVVVPSYEASDNASLEGNIDEFINNIFRLLLSNYPATTTEAVSAIIKIPTTNILNDGLANLIDDTKKRPLHCVNVDIPNNKSERPFRFDSSKAFLLLNDVINDQSAIDAVNSFIGCVDNTVETQKLLEGHFYNFSLGDFNVVLHDMHLENANSVYELELLKPEMDHYHLTNSLGYGMCAAQGCQNTTSFSFGMNLAHSKEGYLGNISVLIDMKNLKLKGGTELRLDMNYLPYLSIKDLLAHPQCLSVPITTFDFYGLNATVDMLEVKIDVNLKGLNNNPRSFRYQDSQLATAVSALMSKASVALEDILGNEFSMQLDKASNVCETPLNPHRSVVTKRSTGGAGLWTLLIILAFVAGNAWLFLRGFKNDEQEEIVRNIEGDEDAHSDGQRESSLSEPLLNDEDGLDENLEVETPHRKFPLASSTSLMYHPSIHQAVKYGFPAMIASAFILFLFSNLSIGASVDLLVTRANGNSLTSPVNIYAFSLGSTMREMVQAGVWLLMLLILFCSGIWPYVKLVLMMVSWIVSTRRLPPVKREKILYLLDSLGKFSLIDAYVLVLMMVAFRYNLEVEGVGALNVYVTPKFGFYSFLFATIMSLIGGHCMLFLHRRTMLPSIPVYSGRYESLSKHIFDDKRGRGLVKLTRRFRRTIVFTLFLAFILICVGVGLKSFHFKFNGVAGTALGDESVRSFSLVSIGQHIPKSVQNSSSFGIHWIQTCYFFFALVTPIVCLLSMLGLFLVPMKLKQQQKVFMLAEIANAWSAIEVFVIAIIASLLEISPFAESMVGEHCSLLNQILSGWSGGGGDDDLHYCFDVKSSLDGTSAVLIIGVILNSLLVSSLHRFAHHAIWERIEREDRPDATENENKMVGECVRAHTFVSRLRKRRLGAFMFEDVSFGPHSEYDFEDFENVAESEEPSHTSNNFWSEWTKIVSVI